jgi:RNA polymerase sigma-70 factor (ECF subfamily)
MTSPSSFKDPIDVWVTEVARRALGYAISLIQSRQDAEDIVHDCFCRLLAKSQQYDLPRDGTKLLFTSITNACINHSKRQKSVPSLHEQAYAETSGVPILADHRAATPLENAIGHELENAVEVAMNKLPVAQRAAIQLRCLGHSSMEIAEALEVSHANARVLLHRARTELAHQLSSYIEETSP